MRVIVTGGTGLIGQSLVEVLMRHDYEIIVVSRDPVLAAQTFRRRGLSVRAVGWDGRTAQGWGELIDAKSALVNLAGASPAHWRWTNSYKARILESRLRAGEAVMQAIEQYGPPEVLVQASAAGYYGDRGQDILAEASAPGAGFRAETCQAWEESTAHTTVRRCVLRTGIVLDTHVGALPSLLLFARLMGSRLGDGRQWIPWMHKRDVARAIQFLIEDRALSGPFNLCAPQPATNQAFLRVARRLLKRFPVFPLPAFALRLLLGEMSSVVLDSERMLPRRLMEAGFAWDYPELDTALRHLLREH